MDRQLRPGPLIPSLKGFQLHLAASTIKQDDAISFTGLFQEQSETNTKMLLKDPANTSYYHLKKYKMDHFAILQLYQIKL